MASLVSKGVVALTTADTILAGYAAQDTFKGKVRAVGKPFTKENYCIGLKRGDTAIIYIVLNDAVTQFAVFVERRRGGSRITAAPITPAAPNIFQCYEEAGAALVPERNLAPDARAVGA